MKKFAYKAFDAKGQPVVGQLEVNDRREIDAFFIEKSLIPVRVAEQKTAFLNDWLRDLSLNFNRKLFDNEVIAFTRQFAAAYSAGIAVPRALKMLSEQLSHPRLKQVLAETAGKIEQGKGLTESFRAFPQCFDGTFLAIMNSGEISGNLDQMLNYAAGLLERRLVNRERIKSTFLYPKLVVGMLIIAVVILLIFVIPQFAKLYDRFHAQLPLPTRALIGLAEVCKAYWWVGALFVPALIVLSIYLRNRQDFMLWLHEKWIHLPIFGSLIIKIELAQFCTTFAVLLRSGIKVTYAAESAADGIKNTFLRQKFQSITPHLEHGGTVSGALEQIDIVPALVASMVTMGEESGNLESLLDKVNALYENEIDLVLKRLPTLIEPIILSVLFALVLGLGVAIYLPLWKMSSLVRGG